MKTAIAAYVFGSRGNSWPMDKLIIWGTRPAGWDSADVPTHSGLIFKYNDGSYDYAEAFLHEDWAVGIDIQKLRDYAQQDAAWVRCFEVPILSCQAKGLRAFADTKVGIWHYSILQLWRVAMHRLFGRKIPATPTAVDCSEAVTRLLLPYWPRLVEETGRKTPEDVAPVDLFVGAQDFGLPLKPIEEVLA